MFLNPLNFKIMFFKPGADIPLYGQPKGAVDFGDGTYLSSTPKSLKIFSENLGAPLIRLDFKAHGNLPENHIQFGHETYTERHGEEAKDLFSHILLTKLRVDMFEK